MEGGGGRKGVDVGEEEGGGDEGGEREVDVEKMLTYQARCSVISMSRQLLNEINSLQRLK